MAKKRKKTDPITHYTIGGGISKMPMVSVDFTRPGLTVEDLDRILPKGTYTFEGRVAFAEKWAKTTIETDGLPTDPCENRVTDRWYAAGILGELRLVRTLIKRGETAHAAHRALDLGMLLRELFDVMLHNKKVLKWEGWQGSGSDGGKADKKIRPLMEWLRRTVKQYPDKPCTFYWNSLPEHDDGDTVEEINGATMIREGNVLVVKDADGRKRFLAKPSFKRYVADVKESLKK